MTTSVDVLAVMDREAKLARHYRIENGAVKIAEEASADACAAHEAVAELIEAVESIADHYDMDGYGPTSWKSLALEMADKARTALARVKGA